MAVLLALAFCCSRQLALGRPLSVVARGRICGGSCSCRLPCWLRGLLHGMDWRSMFLEAGVGYDF